MSQWNEEMYQRHKKRFLNGIERVTCPSRVPPSIEEATAATKAIMDSLVNITLSMYVSNATPHKLDPRIKAFSRELQEDIIDRLKKFSLEIKEYTEATYGG